MERKTNEFIHSLADDPDEIIIDGEKYSFYPEYFEE